MSTILPAQSSPNPTPYTHTPMHNPIPVAAPSSTPPLNLPHPLIYPTPSIFQRITPHTTKPLYHIIPSPTKHMPTAFYSPTIAFTYSFHPATMVHSRLNLCARFTPCLFYGPLYPPRVYVPSGEGCGGGW